MKVRTHAVSGLVVALTLTSPTIADRDCRVASERREAVAQVMRINGLKLASPFWVNKHPHRC